LQNTLGMTSSGRIIDLPDDAYDVRRVQKKRNAQSPRLKYVWIAYYQLEADYHCVGDFENDRIDYSPHTPTMFDKTILGIFVTRKAARECAYKECLDRGLLGDDEDEDDDEEEDEEERMVECDFEDEGVLLEGSESGDVNTFSQRVHIKREKIQRK
jgi:hypothetical protein